MLRDYDDVLGSKVVYSFIGLVSLVAKQFLTCARAIIKLDALNSCTEEEAASINEIAAGLFRKYSPANTNDLMIECNSCGVKVKEESTCSNCSTRFLVCIVTGKFIHESRYFSCQGCRHVAVESEIRGFAACPLCHISLM